LHTPPGKTEELEIILNFRLIIKILEFYFNLI